MIAQTLKSRIHLCAALAALAPLAIAGRLFWLQTFRHEKLSATASKEFQRTVSEIGPRGRVFGAGGELLAESIITWEAGLFKKDLEEPIVSMDQADMWGGIVTLANGWRLELPAMGPETVLPCTVEARRLGE